MRQRDSGYKVRESLNGRMEGKHKVGPSAALFPGRSVLGKRADQCWRCKNVFFHFTCVHTPLEAKRVPSGLPTSRFEYYRIHYHGSRCPVVTGPYLESLSLGAQIRKSNT